MIIYIWVLEGLAGYFIRCLGLITVRIYWELWIRGVEHVENT